MSFGGFLTSLCFAFAILLWLLDILWGVCDGTYYSMVKDTEFSWWVDSMLSFIDSSIVSINFFRVSY
jgi:hypothetical protein